MISSMTGYGRANGEISLGQTVVEVKTVNHRFLDTRIKLPRQLSFLEPQLTTLLKDRLARGRVELSLSLHSNGNLAGRPLLNINLARQYRLIAEQAGEALGFGDSNVSLDFILRMPDVVQLVEPECDPEKIWEEVLVLVEQALSDLSTMRNREGEALRRDFVGVLASMRDICEKLDGLKDIVVTEYRERLQNRMKVLLSDNEGLDATRLHQEVAIFADRADISEELARLASHVDQFVAILDSPESVGRKLDFLLQEMFREANTIGSKSNHIEITQNSLQLKNMIERLREQAQNVE